MVMVLVEAPCESRTDSDASSAEAADPTSANAGANTPDMTLTKTSAMASTDPPSSEAAAHAPDVTPAKTSAVASTDPASTEAAAHAPDVTPAKTSAMASTETSAESAPATPGLCAGYREAPGKRRNGQNHHQSFQHGMLPLHAATHPPCCLTW
jgi:hypothetical protein